MTRAIGSRELKTRLGAYLRQVRDGATILVTDRGEPIAELRPLRSASTPESEATVRIKGRPISETVVEDRSFLITYLDASALVKNYIENTLPAVSRLSMAEVASAFARRCREGDLSTGDRDRLLADLREDGWPRADRLAA